MDHRTLLTVYVFMMAMFSQWYLYSGEDVSENITDKSQYYRRREIIIIIPESYAGKKYTFMALTSSPRKVLSDKTTLNDAKLTLALT